MIQRLFALKQNETTISREILAGLTTFLTMSYIIFVQPAVLSIDFAGNPTGLSFSAVLLATCLVSAFSCVLMGILTNYPIALAPGMGENFFFISVIMSLTALGFAQAWQTALGIVFIAGVLFLIISLFRVREMILNAISPSMRNGIAVGIGLFITFIGLQHGKIIVARPGTMIGINPEVVSVDVGVFLFGLLATAILRARHMKGDILWGILAASLLSFSLGKIQFQGIVGMPVLENTAMMKMDIAGALNLVCLPFIVVFLFMDMFDTLGTLMGAAEAGGLMKNNKLPKARQAFVVDAVGTVAGACMGTSTVTSYIESTTGIFFGGRTGLTSVTVGILFLLSLLFSPIIGIIGQYPPITAPALVIVGCMMIRNVRFINWDDFSEGLPSFLIIVGIPFCYSIADGLALGFISYPVIKFFCGKGKKVSWLMYVLAVILLLYFIFIRSRL